MPHRSVAKVLIAGQDSKTRDAVASSVEVLGYAALQVGSGSVAKGIIADNPKISLLIIDRNLGDMDGRDLICSLRQEGLLAMIPVIIISDKVSINDIDEYLKLGASYFFPKPVKTAELTLYIKKILSKRVEA